MKRIILLLICCIAVLRSQAQFTISLTGYPLVTTGWTHSSEAHIVDSEVNITNPIGSQASYIYFDSAINLTTCARFTADFDFKIAPSGSTCIADGMAFWFISNPPSGFILGSGIGLPNDPNGYIMILDTYDNDATTEPFPNNPLETMLGDDGTFNYVEGSSTGVLGSVVPDVTFLDDATWHHCKVDYNGGNINVYFNYSTTASMTGYYLLSSLTGYFGFSASTGACVSTQSIKNAEIVINGISDPPTTTTPITYCQYATADTLTAVGTGPNLYWYLDDTSVVTALPYAPVPSTTTPGITWYYVRTGIPGCISLPDSIEVIVLPQPAPPTLAGNTFYCADSLYTPVTSTDTGVLWYTTPAGVGTTTPPIINTSIPGTYEIYATQTVNGCISPQDSFTVLVDTIPAIPVITGQTVYCQYDTPTPISATGTNVVWYYTPGGAGTDIVPVVNTSVPGFYTFYANQTTGGCTSPLDSIVITVNVMPTPPVTGSNSPVCSGNTIYLTSFSTPGGGTYSWMGPNGFTSPLQNPAVVAAPMAAGGVYTVTTTLNGCTSQPGYDTVIMNYTPSQPIATSNAPICENNTLLLYGSDTTAGVTYTWSGPGGFTSPDQNPSIPDISAATGSGLYTVTATLGLCSNINTLIVNIGTRPDVPVVTSNSPVCSGDTLFLSAISTAGATYSWVGPLTFYTLLQNPQRDSATTDMSGVYFVTAYLNGCISLAAGTDTVVIHQTPAPPWVVYLTYCQYYDAPPLQANGTNILWYPVDTPGVIGSTVTPTPPTDVPGVTYYYASQTVQGCVSAIDSIEVRVWPKPSVAILPANDIAICPGDSALLTAFDTNYVASYHWTPPLYLSDTDMITTMVHPITSQDYTLVVTDQHNCTDTTERNITVHPAGVIYLPADSVTLHPGETYQLSPETNCMTFSWFPVLGLNDANISNPVAMPTVNTNYIVHAYTEYGCLAIDSIRVFADPETVLVMPNAFAPGNGPNNMFKVTKEGIATLKYFRIFNRWGNKVFETSNIDAGWDGSYKGTAQPLGVFMYEIDAVTSTGIEFIKQGNVTLMR